MEDPQKSNIDPFMEEPFMQEEQFEKLRDGLKKAEVAYIKTKDDIFNFPKSFTPLVTASKQLIQTFEELYPEGTSYSGVTNEISTALNGLISAYNDTVI